MNEVQFIYSCCLALVKREIPGWSENRHKNLKRKICLRFFTKTRQNATALTITNILTLKVKHFGFSKVAIFLFIDLGVFSCRYAISFQAINVYGTKSEFGIDNFSMSPQCFGLGVPKEAIDNWRINMTDTELCKYYGKLFFNSLFSVKSVHAAIF